MTINDRLNPIIFLECGPNGHIPDALLNDRLTLTGMAKAIYGVASALHELHELGIVHFDLNPMDILFKDNMDPLLCDFNRAREVGSMARFDWNADIRYKSPTLLQRQDVRVGTEFDLYSFGMVIIYLLTREPPYNDIRHEEDLRVRILKGELPDLSGIMTEGLQQIILQCLVPGESPPSAKLLLQKLGDELRLLPDLDRPAFEDYTQRLSGNAREVTPKPPKQPWSAKHQSPRPPSQPMMVNEEKKEMGSVLVQHARSSRNKWGMSDKGPQSRGSVALLGFKSWVSVGTPGERMNRSVVRPDVSGTGNRGK
jgi:serine/threonine protein kinase